MKNSSYALVMFGAFIALYYAATGEFPTPMLVFQLITALGAYGALIQLEDMANG